MTATQRKLDLGFGWRKDKPDHRDHVFALPYDQARLPSHVDLRPHMPPVYDQGQLGSCTGNAIAAAMEYNELAKSVPSRLFIYYHERVLEGTVSSDSGAEIRDGLKVVGTIGVPPETDWPYDINRFAEAPPAVAETDAAQHKAIDYARVYPGYGAPLRATLAAGHPVVFGFAVPPVFEELSASNPLLYVPGATDEIIGWHAVTICGYDWTKTRFPVNVYIVRNSWSESWGEAGYFYMQSQYMLNRNVSDDFWVIRKAT